ncbi:unnamed protein product [Dovyalis caffra]|uniref:Uncharacterized protein n=1 Tax=Dovyalis caffra TaxID=77055 RepID=A0AAV1RMI6_9ROSI|nr:unnamed protein product [Dovyalis caffra]
MKNWTHFTVDGGPPAIKYCYNFKHPMHTAINVTLLIRHYKMRGIWKRILCKKKSSGIAEGARDLGMTGSKVYNPQNLGRPFRGWGAGQAWEAGRAWGLAGLGGLARLGWLARLGRRTVLRRWWCTRIGRLGRRTVLRRRRWRFTRLGFGLAKAGAGWTER